MGTAQQTEDASIRVEATKVKVERRLQIELRNGDVFEAIGKIAGVGNLQVIVKGDVKVAPLTLSMENVSPEIALQQLCTAAQLACEIKDGLWIISPVKSADGKPSKLITEMAFGDVEIIELLSLISRQFDIPIAMGGGIIGKIRFLRLQNKTPRQALEIIAQVAELKLEESKDGIFILSKPGEPFKMPALRLPTLQPPPALAPPNNQLPTPEKSVSGLPPGYILL